MLTHLRSEGGMLDQHHFSQDILYRLKVPFLILTVDD